MTVVPNIEAYHPEDGHLSTLVDLYRGRVRGRVSKASRRVKAVHGTQVV
jgi:hypothetical protein